MKTLLKYFLVIAGSAILGLAVGLAVSYAQVVINTWVGPSATNPINYNITGLLNMGPINQVKSGQLSVGGLAVNGGSFLIGSVRVVGSPIITQPALTISNGKLAIQDGTQGAARPLATADTVGTARWAPSIGAWGCASGSALTGINADGTAKCASLSAAGGGSQRVCYTEQEIRTSTNSSIAPRTRTVSCPQFTSGSSGIVTATVIATYISGTQAVMQITGYRNGVQVGQGLNNSFIDSGSIGPANTATNMSFDIYNSYPSFGAVTNSNITVTLETR